MNLYDDIDTTAGSSPELTEEWRSVAEHSGYEVSNLGRVRSIDRAYVDALGVTQHYKGQIRTPNAIGPEWRPKVRLGSKGRTRLVYHLVLEAFVGPAPAGMEACHNDGDPTNSRLDNLRWDTRSANMADAVRHGTHANSRRTHCTRGHLLADPNLSAYSKSKGQRKCLACRRAMIRERYYKDKGVQIDRQLVADECYAQIMGATEVAS